MIRRLLSVASALSMVLCVVIVAMWVRGSAVLEDFEYARFLPNVGGQRAYARDGVIFRDGGLQYAHSLMLLDPLYADSGDSVRVGLQHRRDAWVNTAYYHYIIRPENGIVGFAIGSVHSNSFRGRGVRIPLWFILLISALLPAHCIRLKLLQRLRAREGACPSCGYDLRASKDRCPECGAPISSRKRAPEVRSHLQDH